MVDEVTAAAQHPMAAASDDHWTDVPRYEKTILLAALWAGLALLGRGMLMSSDEGGIFNTAASLTSGSLAIGPGENVHPGRGGKFYSVREILPSLLAVPCVVTGAILDHTAPSSVPPIAPGGTRLALPALSEPNWAIFVTVTVLGPLCIALTLVLLYEFVIADGGDRRTALWMVVATGLSTPLIVYSKTIFPQVVETAILMSCCIWASKWRKSARPAVGLRLGICCGLGVLARPAFLPVTAAFGVYLLCVGSASRRRRLGAIVGFSLAVGASVVITLAINWLKWESPLHFGYTGREEFSTNALVGLAGLLLSPGKGLFIFAPLCLMPALFGRQICREGPQEFWLLIAVTTIYLGIYSRWYDWLGGLCWGPRFLIPLIAPWTALSARALRNGGSSVRVGFVATATAGLLVQAAGAALHPHWLNRVRDLDAFSLTNSHLVKTMSLLVQHGPDDFWAQGVPMDSRTYVAVLTFVVVLGATSLGLYLRVFSKRRPRFR
jgi:hypothetical protein